VVDFGAVPFKRRLAKDRAGATKPWRLDVPNPAGTVGRDGNGSYPGSGADQLDPPEKFLMNDNATPSFDPSAFLTKDADGRTVRAPAISLRFVSFRP
jgi:hypothetical protein